MAMISSVAGRARGAPLLMRCSLYEQNRDAQHAALICNDSDKTRSNQRYDSRCMGPVSQKILEAHFAWVPTDNPFQQRARLLQSLWRAEHGLPVGEHRGRPLGSRLAMPAAEQQLSNYLTPNIRDVVRREVLDPARSKDKLFGRPRIFNDLLSSQPLCFNLFAELSLKLELASRVFARLTSGRVSEVTSINFEYSPGRGDPRYSGDRSAFDVFVRYRAAHGTNGFVGIEVKYHEGLGDPAATHRERYDELARAMNCFNVEATTSRLREKPLQQIWRDHLLAGSLLASGDFDEGFFAFLYPAQNERCTVALDAYRSCLTSASTFETWTLESVVAALLEERREEWVEAVADRYLAFDKIERM